MPEFDWHWGYPLSIMLIAFAAIGSYLFFRWEEVAEGNSGNALPHGGFLLTAWQPPPSLRHQRIDKGCRG